MSNESNEMVQRPQERDLEHVRAERRVAPPVDVYENEDEILLLVARVAHVRALELKNRALSEDLGRLEGFALVDPGHGHPA